MKNRYTYPQPRLSGAVTCPGQNSTRTPGQDSSRSNRQGRIFSSDTRFLLTCEIKGGMATQLVVDERDGVYNFITMYDVKVKDLSTQSTAGKLRLLWPYTFTPK